MLWSESRHVVHSAALTTTPVSAQEGLNGEAPAAEEDAEASLDLTKKKKKKKKARASELEGLEEPEEGEGADADGDGGRTHAGLPWDGTDRDYSYEELLGMSRPAHALQQVHAQPGIMSIVLAVLRVLATSVVWNHQGW